MTHSIPKILGVLLLLSTLTACDRGDTQDINNEFSFTVASLTPNSKTASAASVSQEISGYSFFFDAENPTTGTQLFSIYLHGSENFSRQNATQGLFGFLARTSERPESGTYDFTNPDSTLGTSRFQAALYENFANPQSTPFYVISSGTLTIESSSQNRIVGSIEASGTSFSGSDSDQTQQAVTISGTFTAKSVDTFVPLDTPAL